MTKTRRKAREEADADSDYADEGPSHSTDSLHIPIPIDVDLELLSELLPTIPDFSNITPDTVAVLYKLVLGQNLDLDYLRRELDGLKGEIERKDVELDQALQDKEGLSKELEESEESVHSELAQVRQERQTLGLTCPIHNSQLNRSSCCILQRMKTRP